MSLLSSKTTTAPRRCSEHHLRSSASVAAPVTARSGRLASCRRSDPTRRSFAAVPCTLHRPCTASLRNTRAASSNPASSAPTSTAASKPLPQLPPLDESFDAQHTFTSYANWIIPGAVMLGRYPFVEPSRCQSREQGEKQLEAILKSGMNTFVCLQAELPPQESMTLAGKSGFLPYKSTAELMQSAFNGPPPQELVDGSLRNPTLNKFLPPKRHHLYGGMYKPTTLQFLHSPIVDLGLPSAEDLHTLLADLKQRVAAGEKLYVHCWGGRGRAGTVGACLLAALYGVSADEALQRVQRAFDTRADAQRAASPETEAQVRFVRDFIADLKKK